MVLAKPLFLTSSQELYLQQIGLFLLVAWIDQVDPQFWRSQLVAVPQEPEFLNGTIASNLLAPHKDITTASQIEILHQVGLGAFLDQSEAGLETLLGSKRPNTTGIRKRLALAGPL